MNILTSASVRYVAAGVLVATALLAYPQARAATPAAGAATVTYDTSPCDRACLRAIAERYLSAMLAHDPHQAPLAVNARYTENGSEFVLPRRAVANLGQVGQLPPDRRGS